MRQGSAAGGGGPAPLLLMASSCRKHQPGYRLQTACGPGRCSHVELAPTESRTGRWPWNWTKPNKMSFQEPEVSSQAERESEPARCLSCRLRCRQAGRGNAGFETTENVLRGAVSPEGRDTGQAPKQRGIRPLLPEAAPDQRKASWFQWPSGSMATMP